MTHIDLLNYLMDVQKIEKAELAELLAIPTKKIDGVLCGQIALKKKWLKNLSAYTGIPTECITLGNFTLQYPVEAQQPQAEGEQTPVVPEQTPENEEILKQYNYDKLMDFCKVRYKKRYRDIKQAIVILFACCILNLIFLSAVTVFVFAQTPLTNLWLIPLTCFVPTIMALASATGLFKVTKSGIKSEEKNFKVYSALSILSVMCFTVAGVCFEILPLWALGIAVASILPPVYFVFVKGVKEKFSDKIFILGALVSYFLSGALLISLYAEDFIDRNAGKEVSMAFMIAFVGSWVIVAFALYCVNICYYCYKKFINASKHFEPIAEKQLFKKHHIRNKIIALVLATAIFVCGTYLFSCAIMYWNVDSILNYEETIVPKYSDYNKQNIIFTEADEVTIIDTEFYTFKLPADMKKNEEIKTQDSYNSDPVGGIVMTYTEDNLYGESLSKLYEGEDVEDLDERQVKIMAEFKQEIIDTYGYYPQSAYELKKIIRDIRENGVDFLNRKQAAAVIPILIFDTTLSYDDEVIFYEDEEKELVLSVRRTEHSNTGRTTFTCQVYGNKKGGYEKFVDVTIMLRSDYADEELAYKIINSIEMK